MGILVVAVFFGGIAAVAALIAGHSFWMALAIYSGAGVLGAFVVAGAVLARSAWHPHPQDNQDTRRSRATI